MPTCKSPKLLKKPPKKVFKRGGSVTEVERDLVTQFVQDQPREVTPSQVRALARVMRRSTDTVKSLITDAREHFVEQADRYVEVHRLAVENALSEGDYEEARKGSEWYLTHVSGEGARIIDKQAESGPVGARIFVGLRIGGISEAPTIVEMPVLTIESANEPAK